MHNPGSTNKVENLTDNKQENNKSSTYQDTITVIGSSIIILRPDSLKFQSYLEDGNDWIYEVDSDSGFGVSEALDLLKKPEVNQLVTTKRFIRLIDCFNCPLIIDRDTIGYGLILTRKNEKIKIDQNIFGKEYYIELFNSYFKK